MPQRDKYYFITKQLSELWLQFTRPKMTIYYDENRQSKLEYEWTHPEAKDLFDYLQSVILKHRIYDLKQEYWRNFYQK